MKKTFLLFTIILTSMVLIFACSKKDGKEGATTLTFWNGYTGPDREFLEDLVEEFNDTHDDIQIKMDIMPWDTMYQKLSATMSTGDVPDFVVLGTYYAPKFHEEGLMVPIDDILGTKENLDTNLIPDAMKEFYTIDGKYYGFPMGMFANSLYYNKDLFKEAGLDPNNPPKNWDELIEYAVKLTDKADAQYGFALSSKETVQNWPILLWGNGGSVVDDAKEKGTLNSPQNIETVKLFADLILNKSIAPPMATGADASKLFTAGKAAMMIGGPWETTGYTKAGLNYGVAQVPAGPKNDVTYGEGLGMFITTGGAEKKEEIAEYFNFWMSKKSQTYWSLNTGYPPGRNDIINDSDFDDAAYVKEFAKSMEKGKGYLVGMKQGEQIDREGVVTALEQILLNNVDVKEALDKANDKINDILSKK